MSAPGSNSPKKAKSPRASLGRLMRSFSKARSERPAASPENSPRLAEPGRRAKAASETSATLDALPYGTVQPEASTSPPSSPYYVALVKREQGQPQAKLPRSLSSPRSSRKVRSASQPTSPLSPVESAAIATAAVATTTTTTTATTTGFSVRTSTTTASQKTTTTTTSTTPLRPSEKRSPGSPSHLRAQSSPGRIQSGERGVERSRYEAYCETRKQSERFLSQFKSLEFEEPQSALQAPLPEQDEPSQVPPVSPGTASERLGNEQASMRSPAPLRYPEQAHDWIDAASFKRLCLAGQQMMVGFCAVRQLYEEGQATFGQEWAWPVESDAPLRNWAQRGSVKRDEDSESEYFDGRVSFEKAYANGTLGRHLASKIEEVSKLPPGEQRRSKIRFLAKQADHVLNLALESLRLITLRKEVTPQEVVLVWEAMTAKSPNAYQLGTLRNYFGEDGCIAVQAFLNAFFWQLETMRKWHQPETERQALLNTFHFLGPHLLGYPYNDFLNLQTKLRLDEIERTLTYLGMDQKQLAAMLTLARKQAMKFTLAKLLPGLGKEQPGINEAGIEKVSEKLESHGDDLSKAAHHSLPSRWLNLLFRLAQGDQRFMSAAGLKITDALPATWQQPASPRAAPATVSTLPSTQASASTAAPLSPTAQPGKHEEESGSFLDLDQ